jgi:hypothetical protein
MVDNSNSAIKLANLFSAVNRKDRNWWEQLNDDQRKKFSSWLYSRYMSIVRHNNPDMHRYYLMGTNNAINRHLSSLTKNHAKLIYLLMTTLPNEFAQADHQYIPPMKKNKADKKTNNKMRILTQLNPNFKDDDLETLASVMTDDEFAELMESHGWESKKIKAELKR